MLLCFTSTSMIFAGTDANTDVSFPSDWSNNGAAFIDNIDEHYEDEALHGIVQETNTFTYSYGDTEIDGLDLNSYGGSNTSKILFTIAPVNNNPEGYRIVIQSDRAGKLTRMVIGSTDTAAGSSYVSGPQGGDELEYKVYPTWQSNPAGGMATMATLGEASKQTPCGESVARASCMSIFNFNKAFGDTNNAVSIATHQGGASAPVIAFNLHTIADQNLFRGIYGDHMLITMEDIPN